MTPKQNKLTVLHIASGDLWGGAEMQLYSLAQELQNHTNLHIILLNKGELSDRLVNCNISTTILNEQTLSGIQILTQLIRLVRKIKPQIIHTHRQKENVLGSISSLFIKDCVSLRTQHGAAEHKITLRQAHKQIFRILDLLAGRYIQKKIIAVSDDLKCQLENTFSADKIITVYNGVNITEIIKQSNAFQVKLPVSIKQLEDKTKKIINVGIFARLVPVKRIDIFIEVSLKLKNSTDNIFNFYIYGDGPLKQKLNEQIISNKLEDRVFMMGHTNNVYPHMKEMDFILITSDHEGLPMNLLEAMTLNVPVIAHAVGGIPNTIGENNSGLLVYENNAEKYAEKLRSTLNSNKAFNLHARVSEKFSANRNFNNINKIYLSLLGHKSH